LVLLIGILFGGAGILLTRLTVDYGLGAYIFTYCILFGIGMGLPYSVIFHVASLWFPAYRATVVGIIAAGFGLGAFLFTPIQTVIINPDNLKANGTKFPAEVEARIPNAYLILGGIFVALEIIATCIMRECPTAVLVKSEPTIEDGESDEEAFKKEVSHESPKMQKSYTVIEALKSIDFYILSLIVFCDIIPVVLFTSTYKVFGISQHFDDKFLSIIATVSSGFNCGGRIIWGLLVDHFSSKCPLMVLLLQWGILLITFPFLVVIGGKYVFACYVFAIFFHLSGHFVIIPGACTRIFGPGNMATIYGLVYATTAPSALITAAIVSQFTIGNNWVPIYAVCGIACISGFLMSLFLLDEDVRCVSFTNICTRVCNPCRIYSNIQDDELEEHNPEALNEENDHVDKSYKPIGDA